MRMLTLNERDLVAGGRRLPSRSGGADPNLLMPPTGFGGGGGGFYDSNEWGGFQLGGYDYFNDGAYTPVANGGYSSEFMNAMPLNLTLPSDPPLPSGTDTSPIHVSGHMTESSSGSLGGTINVTDSNVTGTAHLQLDGNDSFAATVHLSNGWSVSGTLDAHVDGHDFDVTKFMAKATLRF